MTSLFVVAVVAIMALGLWVVPQNGIASTPQPEIQSVPRPVGTSGTSASAHDRMVDEGDTITEVETITGTNDAMALVGRRVDLHVDVQERANDRAFWVGPRDNRLLVVLGGENRSRAERPQHHISPVHAGQRATISGFIRAVPRADKRDSWTLTRNGEKELSERKVYIRADSVSSEGHGTH